MSSQTDLSSVNDSGNASDEATEYEDPLGNNRYLVLTDGECDVFGLLMLVGGSVGGLGNLLVLVTYFLRRNKLIPDYLIMYVTVIDFVGCAMLLPAEYVWVFRKREPVYGCSLTPGELDALASYLETSSAFALLIIALDRYLSICHPFLTGITVPRLLALLLLSNLFSVPLAWFFMEFDEGFLAQFAHLIYGLFLWFLLFFISFLYTLVFMRVRRRAQRRREQNMIPLSQKTSAAARMISPANGEVGSPKATHSEYLHVELSCFSTGRNVPQSQTDRQQLTSNVSSLFSYISRGGTSTRNAGGTSRISDAMSSLSRRILITMVLLTLLFAICFLPNSILSQIYFWNPSVLTSSPLAGASVRYLQMLYHANFVLAPFVYAIMSQKFRTDLKENLERLTGLKSSDTSKQLSFV